MTDRRLQRVLADLKESVGALGEKREEILVDKWALNDLWGFVLDIDEIIEVADQESKRSKQKGACLDQQNWERLKYKMDGLFEVFEKKIYKKKVTARKGYDTGLV